MSNLSKNQYDETIQHFANTNNYSIENYENLNAKLALELVKFAFFALSFVLILGKLSMNDSIENTLFIFISGAWADNLSIYGRNKKRIYDASFVESKIPSFIGSVVGTILVVISLYLACVKAPALIYLRNLISFFSLIFLLVKVAYITNIIRYIYNNNYGLRISTIKKQKTKRKEYVKKKKAPKRKDG